MIKLTGPRIIVTFQVNNATMGQIIPAGDEQTVRDIAGRVIGTDEIKEVAIIKNGATLFTEKGKGRVTTISYSDKTPVQAGDYYYLRAIQEDEEVAWSSPIWLEPQKTKK